MQSGATNHSTRDWLAVIFALVLPTLVTMAYFVLAAELPSTVQQATYGVAKTFQFVFPIAYVLLIQRRRLHPEWSTRGIGIGLLFGLIVGASMCALYHFGLKSTALFASASESIRSKAADINLGTPAVFMAVGVFYSLVHSLLEEYYWRWFVFGQLRRLVRINSAVIISSLGFMTHHVLVIGTYFGFNSLLTWIFSLAVAVGGAVWAWLFERTGSLFGPWLSHLIVDAAIFFIGYQIVVH